MALGSPGPQSGDDAILASLNPAQRRAVTSTADTVAILAGPGSGKTHTLASRVVWLVDRVGLRPADIVVATFTVKAAREMKERIGRALGPESRRDLVLGTFHSIARRYLARYGRRIGLDPRFGIADSADSHAAILRICRQLRLAVDPVYARSWISKQKASGFGAAADKGHTHNGAKNVPRGGGGGGGAVSPELAVVMAEYQAHLDRSRLLDYDDLLVRCGDLLRQHPGCVANVQAVLIDEYQDTNGAQYDLMRLLASARGRITVVGDPDQSIYGWRSAEVRNLSRLLVDCPAADQIALEDNYRSSQRILAAALAVIQQDRNRYPKALKPVCCHGPRPVLRKLRSPFAEAQWIVAETRRLVAASGNVIRLDDIAVLLRSAALSRHLESALGKAGIAYKMVGGFKFYDRVEVKIVLDYLRVVHQPNNNDALARILNVPPRGIGDGTVQKLLDEADQSKLSLWDLLVKHCRGHRTARTAIRKGVQVKLNGHLLATIVATRKAVETVARTQAANKTKPDAVDPSELADIVDGLVRRIGLENHLKDKYGDDHEQRWANVRELIQIARDFVPDDGELAGNEEELVELGGAVQQHEPETADPLGRFLANVALASDVQARQGAPGEALPAVVTLSTIHAAKGLEWPVVFVPAVYTGSIPHSRADDMDEERRLLYVAMTRAKALLYLSWPLYLGRKQETGSTIAQLSPFLPPSLTGLASGDRALFADRGPNLEPQVVEELANLLGRPAPARDIVRRMIDAGDTLFPVDPAGGDSTDEATSVRFKSVHLETTWRAGGQSPPAKRLRTDGGNGYRAVGKPQGRREGRTPDEDGGSTVPWIELAGRRMYATTMELATTFTVPTLIANATNTTRAAAKATEASATRSADSRLSKNPPNQTCVDGFVARRGAAEKRPAQAAGRPESWSPLAAAHAVARGNLTAKPRAAARRDDDATLPPAPRRAYPCFSSSPPRASEAPGVAPVPPPTSSPVEPTQAAACFHTATTTTALVKAAGTVGTGARLARLAGLGAGDGGIAPMDRLRRPFRPLTINKSHGMRTVSDRG